MKLLLAPTAVPSPPSSEGIWSYIRGGVEAGHPGPDEEAPSEVQSARLTASPPSSDCSMGFDA